jgi:RHS repeat-associated protein
MLQLTHLTSNTKSYNGYSFSGGGVDMQYIYNTGHNNGRVSQTIDNVLGETVNYTYDYLHRLTGATATNSSWGEAYSFDGFGNLTGKTPTVGTAPVFLGSAGSNATGGALPPNFDIENRLASNRSANLDTISYIYDPWGRRVWKQDNGATTTAEAYFYGATGQKLETYNCVWDTLGNLWGSSEGINTYFAGKMLSEKGVFLATDRLGSVRADSNGVSMSYYPWGEERGQGTPDNRTKFAGYFRDWPGQDYAMARYYSANSASFWSPDPKGAGAADAAYGSGVAASYTPGLGAAKPDNPLTWNRYSYSLGDPINFFDPIGTEQCSADGDDCDDDDCGDALDPCSADPDPGGGDLSNCTPNSDGTVSCTGTTVTVTASPLNPPQTALAPTPPGILSTVGGIISQVGTVLGAAAGIIFFPVSNDGCDTLSCPGAPGYNPGATTNKEEICWAQYQADLDICRALHSASCYDQAAQRYANCLVGKALPPLPYNPPSSPVKPSHPRPRKPFKPRKTRVGNP